MRSVSYESVLNRAIGRWGYLPEQVQEQERAVLNDAIDEAIGYVWEFYPWYDLMEVAAVYPAQSEATLWQRDNQADVEPADTALPDVYWERDSSGDLVVIEGLEIDNSGTGFYIANAQEAFGEIYHVWRDNPFSTQDPRVMDTYWRGGKLMVKGALNPGAPVYVEYRRVRARYTARPYNAADAYQEGDRVLYPAVSRAEGGSVDQEVYRCIETGAAGRIPSEEDNGWVLVEVPQLAEDFTVAYTVGMMRSQEGQLEKGVLGEKIAEQWLYRKIDQQDNQVGRNRYWQPRR